jgi:hypothetical protein
MRKDTYLLPRVDDTLDELEDATFYSQLDLAYGCEQIQVREEDVRKTAFDIFLRFFEIFEEWRLDKRPRPTSPPVGTQLSTCCLREGA